MGFGIALAIGGSILNAMSSRSAANSAKGDARENARLEEERFQHDKVILLKDQAFERGQNIIQAGASGLDASSFSDVFSSNEINNQLDLEAIRLNSNMAQRVFSRQASNARTAGQAAIIGGITDIGTALI